MTVVWRSLAEGEAWVRRELAGWHRPCVVLLSGEMGAGKTQVARWIVAALSGGSESVTSPTFGIHHFYSGANVDHVDLYRLQSDEDLESTGFWDLFLGDDRFVIVEWADRLPANVWPAGWMCARVSLRVLADGSREVAYDARVLEARSK